jgi:hypothetical protein
MKTPRTSNTPSLKLAGKPPAGRVGIFWVFEDKVLAATYALKEGQEYGDAINGLTDHVKYWPHFQKLLPALRHLEYQDVPRGRVLFMRPTGKYHVYMDKVLHNLKTKRALLKEFELPQRTTRFLMDAHYTTDWEDLQNLFT